MSLILFEGIAGTGKTTRLIKTVETHVQERPLQECERVLALTKMHGSRKRMHAKLSSCENLRRYADCITVDSFARNLVRRWRGAVRMQMEGLPADGEFQAMCEAAAFLLEENAVRVWVSHRYPVVLVDEMQDCKGPEVAILSHLMKTSKCFCAADEFQDLSGMPVNEAVSWARNNGTIEPLTVVHRTSDTSLLKACMALRGAEPLNLKKTASFEVRAVPTAPPGGGFLVWRVKEWISRGASQIAIISPTQRGTSPFVDNLIEWVSSKTSTGKNGVSAGPYPITWEATDEDEYDKIISLLELPEDSSCELDCRNLADAAERVKAVDVQDWLLRHHKLGGVNKIQASEAYAQIRRIVHGRRAFGYTTAKRRFALTVHQAKNREFDSVIVLWPMKVKSDLEQNRRLLYNAISRAKHRAVVVVEDPKSNRLSSPPFGSE